MDPTSAISPIKVELDAAAIAGTAGAIALVVALIIVVLWRSSSKLRKQKEHADWFQSANQQLTAQHEQLAAQYEALQAEYAREMAKLKLAHNDVINEMKATRGVEITEIYRAHATEISRLHQEHLEALAKQAFAFRDAGVANGPKERNGNGNGNHSPKRPPQMPREERRPLRRDDWSNGQGWRGVEENEIL